MREPSDYFAEFAERLAALGTECKLFGALAAIQYRAEPRTTTDVDFLARSIDGVAEAMRADGFEVKSMAEPGGDPYILFIRGNGVRVDVMLAETEFQQSALDRADGPYITAEDVIVFKLLAWRSRDRDDVESILESGRELDEAYIEHWADEWQVRERWEEAKRSMR